MAEAAGRARGSSLEGMGWRHGGLIGTAARLPRCGSAGRDGFREKTNLILSCSAWCTNSVVMHVPSFVRDVNVFFSKSECEWIGIAVNAKLLYG